VYATAVGAAVSGIFEARETSEQVLAELVIEVPESFVPDSTNARRDLQRVARRVVFRSASPGATAPTWDGNKQLVRLDLIERRRGGDELVLQFELRCGEFCGMHGLLGVLQRGTGAFTPAWIRVRGAS